MDVAGPVLNGLKDDEIDEADDRGLVGEPLHHRRVVRDRRLGGFLGDVLVGAQFLENVRNIFHFLGVILLDGLLDLGRVGDDQLNVLFDQEAEFVNAGNAERIYQGNLERGILQADRQALVGVSRLGGNEPQQFG